MKLHKEILLLLLLHAAILKHLVFFFFFVFFFLFKDKYERIFLRLPFYCKHFERHCGSWQQNYKNSVCIPTRRSFMLPACTCLYACCAFSVVYWFPQRHDTDTSASFPLIPCCKQMRPHRPQHVSPVSWAAPSLSQDCAVGTTGGCHPTNEFLFASQLSIKEPVGALTTSPQLFTPCKRLLFIPAPHLLNMICFNFAI